MVRAGSSTGQTATTRSSAMPAAGAASATRSAKLPPSEKPPRNGVLVRVQPGDAPHSGDDLRQARRVEQLAVQVMARAVIAQVQAEHREAVREQVCARRQQVRRVRGAVPAVDQDREAAFRAWMRRIHSVQANAVAAVEDLLARGGLQRTRAAAYQRAARTAAREPGLQVCVAEPRRRPEVGREVDLAFRERHGEAHPMGFRCLVSGAGAGPASPRLFFARIRAHAQDRMVKMPLPAVAGITRERRNRARPRAIVPNRVTIAHRGSAYFV